MLADALARGGWLPLALTPGAVIGSLLLLVALVRGGGTLGWALGWALGIGGATYVGAVVAGGHRLDGTVPLMALLLILCGELATYSLEERTRIRTDGPLARRRLVAIAALALVGLAASTLVVALAAAPPGHGLLWTVVGVLAAVGAAGASAQLARR